MQVAKPKVVNDAAPKRDGMREHPAVGIFGELIQAETRREILGVFIGKVRLCVTEKHGAETAQGLIELVGLLVRSIRKGEVPLIIVALARGRITNAGRSRSHKYSST